jgi:hypothetical protein
VKDVEEAVEEEKAESFVLAETKIKSSASVEGELSFARLDPDVFDEFLFLPDRAKYSVAQQSVAKAATQLQSEWRIDKKIRDMTKLKAKYTDNVMKCREAAAKIKMYVVIKSRLSETAALKHLDSIVALRFHPRKDSLTCTIRDC